jgi:hypothetical protein
MGVRMMTADSLMIMAKDNSAKNPKV